eukprot:a511528_83.p2 GENE.a511528_83~~a511528_83.p2  ORF type:complete len:398 (+),score=201.73 a511528_83:33-1196(+)
MLRSSASVLAGRAAAAAVAARTMATKTLQFDVTPFQGHKLDELPATTVQTTGDELMKFFREMTHYRRLELTAEAAYKEKLIRGFCHLAIGQEAVCAGLEASLTKEDLVITAYRDHNNMQARGASDVAVFAELFGRQAGCSRGKGGSMHMYLPNFFGGNGIVGAQIPLGAGLALALKHKGKRNVAHVMYGDGASNQGQVFEAFNMAKLWKLPAIFICENNKYGMGTSAERAAANTKYYTRGDYIPGLLIDGMDVLAVKQGASWAKEWVLKNECPMVLELSTYRYRGHSMSDPGVSYRSRDEIKAMQDKSDCIENLRSKIVANAIATDDDLKKIEKDVRKQVEAARDEALKSPELPASELITNIYPEKSSFYVRNVEVATSFPKGEDSL